MFVYSGLSCTMLLDGPFIRKYVSYSLPPAEIIRSTVPQSLSLDSCRRDYFNKVVKGVITETNLCIAIAFKVFGSDGGKYIIKMLLIVSLCLRDFKVIKSYDRLISSGIYPLAQANGVLNL